MTNRLALLANWSVRQELNHVSFVQFSSASSYLLFYCRFRPGGVGEVCPALVVWIVLPAAAAAGEQCPVMRTRMRYGDVWNAWNGDRLHSIRYR